MLIFMAVGVILSKLRPGDEDGRLFLHKFNTLFLAPPPGACYNI